MSYRVFKMLNPYWLIQDLIHFINALSIIDLILLVASILNVIFVYSWDCYMSCHSTKEAAVTCSDSFLFGSVEGSLTVDRNLMEDLFIEAAEICFLFFNSLKTFIKTSICTVQITVFKWETWAFLNIPQITSDKAGEMGGGRQIQRCISIIIIIINNIMTILH